MAPGSAGQAGPAPGTGVVDVLGDGLGDCVVGVGVGDGDEEDGDGDGDLDGEGLGDGDVDEEDDAGDGEDEVGAVDVAAVDVAAEAGDGECVGEGDGDGEGEAEDSDGDPGGWSTTDCTGTGWFRELGLSGPGRVMAAAVAATTAIATPAVMAALTGLNRRNRRIRYTSVPCTAGGVPDGQSAASSRAASPRCDRPRSCQSGPYPPDAIASSSVTKAAASAGRCRRFLAIPAVTSGRSGSGTGSSGTGSTRCCRSRISAVFPVKGGRPARHS